MAPRTLIIFATCATALVATTVSAGAARPDHAQWTVTNPQNPSTEGNYFDDAVTFGPSDVWATGAWYRPKTSTTGTLTEHWDGSAWKLVRSPNATWGYNELEGVSATAPDDIWGVGYHNRSGYISERTLAEHWDGSRWSIVDTPNLGSNANQLADVVAIAPDDVWAVGFGNDPGGFIGHAIAEHWDGHAWTLTDLAPNGAAGSALEAVTATAADDVWAVGHQDSHTLVEHFDGSTWSVVRSPQGAGSVNDLAGVAAVGSDDVWAVGSSGSGDSFGTADGESTLTLHWNGTAWRRVPSPNGSSESNALQDVQAFGPDDVYAGGFSYDELEVTAQTLLEHWDGTRWRTVATPNPDPDYNEIEGLAGQDAAHLWLLGGEDRNILAMHD